MFSSKNLWRKIIRCLSWITWFSRRTWVGRPIPASKASPRTRSTNILDYMDGKLTRALNPEALNFAPQGKVSGISISITPISDGSAGVKLGR